MAGNNAASDGRSSCGLPWWQGGGQAVWHPFCHRQVQADPHRRGTGSCHFPPQQDGVCSVCRATHPTACSNCEFYLSFGTLLPCTVLFVSKFKHCNVCCSRCFLDAWTQADADACVNWWSVLQIFVSQKSSFQNVIARIQEMNAMMKRMIQFLLNCTFSRYFDSEFLEGKKKFCSFLWWQIPYQPLSGQILAPGSCIFALCSGN